MSQAKLKPFEIETDAGTVTVKPNVEYPQSAGPNWYFREWYGVLKFQTKKGALKHFQRVNKKASIK